MKLARLLAFCCYVAATVNGAGWFVQRSATDALAFLGAGAALELLAGVAITAPRR